jgi:hypothetical protein
VRSQKVQTRSAAAAKSVKPAAAGAAPKPVKPARASPTTKPTTNSSASAAAAAAAPTAKPATKPVKLLEPWTREKLGKLPRYKNLFHEPVGVSHSPFIVRSINGQLMTSCRLCVSFGGLLIKR